MSNVIDLKKPLVKTIEIKFGPDYPAMLEYVVGINDDLRDKIRTLENEKPEVPQSEYIKTMEQGSWSAIAKVALNDTSMAIEIAKTLQCSTDHIHEFDMEYLIEAFGSEQAFFDALEMQ